LLSQILTGDSRRAEIDRLAAEVADLVAGADPVVARAALTLVTLELREQADAAAVETELAR